MTVFSTSRLADITQYLILETHTYGIASHELLSAPPTDLQKTNNINTPQRRTIQTAIPGTKKVNLQFRHHVCIMHHAQGTASDPPSGRNNANRITEHAIR